MSARGGGGKKPLTKYERRAARQRQLEQMEAHASGTATSMNLETAPLDSQGRVVSMRQRNQETARRFLYDEDEAGVLPTGGGPSSMKNTSTASLFVGRTAASGRDGMTTVNLMDHETGVYSEEGDRSFSGRLRRMLFGPDPTPQHPQPIEHHHDAIAADTELYLGGDTHSSHPRASRFSSVMVRLRYLCCSSYQRMLVAAISVVILVIALLYTIEVMKEPDPKTAEAILRAENTDRFLDIMDHIIDEGLGDLVTFADFGSNPARALRWIAYSDPARLEPDDPMIVQRFALAVFFYTSHIHYVFATKAKGTKLDNGIDDQNELVPNSGWYNQKNWLTGKGYCSWAGIECEIQRVGNIETRVYDGNANIYSINLSNNFVHGPIVEEFKAFRFMERLDLSENRIDGTLPEAIRYLPLLRYIKLELNRMKGALPPAIGNMQSALEIHFAHNQFNGTLPSELNRMSNLRYFDISYNQFMGEFPNVRSLSNLRTIQISNNQFDGTVPFSFASLVQINEIYMEKNNFHGTIAPEFETFRHLHVFSAFENQIYGPFPNGIFRSNVELRSVMVHRNKLTGTVPTYAGQLQELQTLQMHDNLLTGTFPTQWTNMPKLEFLQLQNNRMHGTIPPNIGTLKALKELYLSNNTLDGPIPPELGSCESLQVAYFDHNQLEETLPTELGIMTRLQTLRLESNKMDGAVPDEVCSLKSFNALKFISTDCSMTCECCNKCY